MAMLQAATESGIVEGVRAGCQTVTIFKGVPFAAPPVGDLRWRAPRPAKSWEGVRPAKEYAKIPMQAYLADTNFHKKEFYPENLPMDEDCLYLNVWTPAATPGENLPVALYFFGGGFMRGYAHSQQYDGEALSRQGIVYISANVRTNGFGYMQHPDLTAEESEGAGNYGLLDMIAVIKWVRRNATAFGGDPNRITIFGQSSGGTSCQLLTCTEKTRGDIAGAVLQSGGGLGDNPKVWPLRLADAEHFGIAFFRYAGLHSLAEARKMPAVELNRLLIDFFRDTKGKMRFKPCIDGYVISDSPSEIQCTGRNHDIHYMIGCTENETPKDPECRHPFSEDFLAEAHRNFGAHADAFIQTLNIKNEEQAEAYLYTARANYKKAAMIAFAEAQLRLGREPAFCYVFDQTPPLSDIGAFHSAEHMYVFQILERSWRPYAGEDYDVSVRANRFWGNFIKYGDPNGEMPDGEWKPYTKAQPGVLRFKNGGGMFPAPSNHMIDFLIKFNLHDLDKE